MKKPALETISHWFQGYVKEVEEDELPVALDLNTNKLTACFRGIDEDKWNYRYAPGKWSIKQMVQHVIDAERIFAFRALCFARGEKTSLPGFEEDDYAAASKADKRSKEELINEFSTVRLSIRQLFQSFDEEQLGRVGMANNNSFSVNAIGFIIVGHAAHHLKILKERYLP